MLRCAILCSDALLLYYAPLLRADAPLLWCSPPVLRSSAALVLRSDAPLLCSDARLRCIAPMLRCIAPKLRCSALLRNPARSDSSMLRCTLLRTDARSAGANAFTVPVDICARSCRDRARSRPLRPCVAGACGLCAPAHTLAACAPLRYAYVLALKSDVPNQCIPLGHKQCIAGMEQK